MSASHVGTTPATAAGPLADDVESSRPAGRGAATVAGVVTAQLPSGLYQVAIDGDHRITAHVGGGYTRNFVRLLVGDRVAVELTPRDRTRGRIVKKA
jgi:translation initiation factor IF-1